jgi:hypothetical protein
MEESALAAFVGGRSPL